MAVEVATEVVGADEAKEEVAAGAGVREHDSVLQHGNGQARSSPLRNPTRQKEVLRSFRELAGLVEKLSCSCRGGKMIPNLAR